MLTITSFRDTNLIFFNLGALNISKMELTYPFIFQENLSFGVPNCLTRFLVVMTPFLGLSLTKGKCLS